MKIINVDCYPRFEEYQKFDVLSNDGPEVDILTAARTGFISQGLAIFVLENIRQSRDFIAHGWRFARDIEALQWIT